MNKAEEERTQKIMRLGCAACAHLAYLHIAQENHHILDGGRRLGDWYTLPLCRGHHQGDWDAEQLEVMDPKHRVSISDGRKLFTRIYGPERDLWERVQQRLKLSTVWPVSKLVPRSVAS